MRVCLIQPSMISTQHAARRCSPYLPLGLGMLATALRDEGHYVKIVDALTEGWELRGCLEEETIEVGLPEEDVAAQIRRFKPQVVGFSIPFSSQLPRLKSLARWVKAIHPEIFVVCGGRQSAQYLEEILGIREVDAALLGAGLRTVPYLVERLENGLSLENIPGLMLRDRTGRNVVSARRPEPHPTAIFPDPAYDLLPLKKYFKAIGSRRLPLCMTWDEFGAAQTASMPLPKDLKLNAINCFPTDYLIKQIRHLSEYYGVREFSFEGEELSSARDWIAEFIDRLIAEEIHIHWTARVGFESLELEEPILHKMKKSGGSELSFYIGSGSRRVLHHIFKRPLDLYRVEKSMTRALAAGLKVSCYFVLGAPGETIEEIYDTLNFAWKLRSQGVNKFYFNLYSDLRVEDDSQINSNTFGLRSVAAASNSPQSELMPTSNLLPGLPREDLIRICDDAQREFNSRGLVIELSRLVASGKKLEAAVEDRFFTSVAPRPRLKVPPEVRLPLRTSQVS